jgi:hypothetical protein
VYRTHLDFETRSLADLPKVGADAYAQHPTTSPLMLSHYSEGLDMLPGLLDFFADPQYAATRFPAQGLDSLLLNSYKPPCPQWWIDAVARGDMFVAHNARFEQAITFWILVRQWGWPMPARWSCTAARSRYWGLRASLDGSASDLELRTFRRTRTVSSSSTTFASPASTRARRNSAS